MDLATFRKTFPEFGTNTQGVPDTHVQAFLDLATLEVDAEVWGNHKAQGVGYLAAHKLCLSPYGVAVRNNVKDLDGTTYLTEYTRIQNRVALSRASRVI